jgi:hypothetical protein
MLSSYDTWATREPEPSRWPVTGRTRIVVYRTMPAPMAEPPVVELDVEVEVADGEVDGPGCVKGTCIEVALTDEEQAEAVRLVEYQ